MPSEEQKRFNGVLAEIEERKNVCNQCNGTLHWIEVPLEGIGDIAALPFLYCQTCDLYYICGEDDEDQ